MTLRADSLLRAAWSLFKKCVTELPGALYWRHVFSQRSAPHLIHWVLHRRAHNENRWQTTQESLIALPAVRRS